jgi:AcrR family transcriptional regulator
MNHRRERVTSAVSVPMDSGAGMSASFGVAAPVGAVSRPGAPHPTGARVDRGRTSTVARVSDEGGSRPPGQARGDRRRAQLVEAGVQIMAERGWARMTARVVADRAGAQLGLIHYHFGGFPQLKRAVAAAVIDGAFRPVVDTMARSDEWQDGLAAAITAEAEHRSSAAGRLAAELVIASLQDLDVRDELAEALRAARARVAAILRDRQVPGDHAEGLATVTAAMLDGLLLHSLIDESLDLAAAAAAAHRLRAGPASTDPPRPTAGGSPPGRRAR